MKHIIQHFIEEIVDVESVGLGVYGNQCLCVYVKSANSFIFELGKKIGSYQEELDTAERDYQEFGQCNTPKYLHLDCNIPNDLRIETDVLGVEDVVYFPEIGYVNDNRQ